MLRVNIIYDRSKLLRKLQASKIPEMFRNEVIDTAKKQAEELTKSRAEEVYLNLQRYTPVRTGRLRAGWRMQKISEGYLLYNEVPYAELVAKRTNFVRKAMV